MNLTVKLEGDLLEKIKTAGIFTKTAIVAGVKDASTMLMEDVMLNAPKSTGDLTKSIRREFFDEGMTAQIFPTVEYAYELHGEDKARGEYSPPQLIPAKEAKVGGSLYRWAKKKGVNPWAIRAVIAKKGHKYQPWIKETADQDQDKVSKVFEDVLDKIANHLGD